MDLDQLAKSTHRTLMVQTRLRISLALRGLLQKRMIAEEEERSEYDGVPYSVYKPLDLGAEWAERNLLRIEELAAEVAPAGASTESDDIPF